MKFRKITVLYFLLIIIVYACAKIGTPIGGPKDITPPKVVSSKPANNAIHFDGKKVDITFDEFIKFLDIQKVFVTSPPFKKKPEVILKYKTVEVNFKEGLLPNTTYTLNFGSAIADNNEGNPIRDYDFVFSTGDKIDSLSFEGKVVTAYDHKPDKDGLFVMLYAKPDDSVALNKLPAYATKTNEKGFFRIHHMHADTFKVIAIKDNNNNYLFDPGEEVAFSDSLLILNSSYYRAPDTTVIVNRDTSSKSDSLYYSRFKPQMELYYFQGSDKKQYLDKKERKQANQMFFKFNAPLDTFKISLLNQEAKTPWFLKEEGLNHDSVTLWITDTALVKKDTLKTLLIYPMLDSTKTLRPKYDTLTMVYKPLKVDKRQKAAKKKAEPLHLISNVKDGFDLNSKIMMEANEPIESIDEKKIYFTYKEDTIKKPVDFSIWRDSVNRRRFIIDFKPVSETSYFLTMDSMAVTSMYKVFNDSSGMNFKTQKEDFYGSIKLTLSNIQESIILQVMDEKETLLKNFFLAKDQMIKIDFLTPRKYILKVIHDSNNNGRWDTGDFMTRRQPEKVEYYKNPVPVRSNWDVEINWKLGEAKNMTTVSQSVQMGQ